MDYDCIYRMHLQAQQNADNYQKSANLEAICMIFEIIPLTASLVTSFLKYIIIIIIISTPQISRDAMWHNKWQITLCLLQF